MIRHNVFRALWALWKDGYLRDHGWFRSFFEQSPVDGAGRPIPWMGYGVIDFLEERLKRDFRVFEFGSGGSTLFWASRCAEVISYEASQEWYERMAPQMPGNVRLLLRGGESFYLPKEDFGTFDLIVVDGMNRNRLLDFALALCHERSVILWDDSMREEYCPSFKFLRAKGWKQLRMSGIGPIQNCRRETSFFYRPGNCLEI